MLEIKRLKSGFELLQAFRGRAEVTPIDPFNVRDGVRPGDELCASPRYWVWRFPMGTSS